jgi:hypothetical protein
MVLGRILVKVGLLTRNKVGDASRDFQESVAYPGQDIRNAHYTIDTSHCENGATALSKKKGGDLLRDRIFCSV